MSDVLTRMCFYTVAMMLVVVAGWLGLMWLATKLARSMVSTPVAPGKTANVPGRTSDKKNDN